MKHDLMVISKEVLLAKLVTDIISLLSTLSPPPPRNQNWLLKMWMLQNYTHV